MQPDPPRGIRRIELPVPLAIRSANAWLFAAASGGRGGLVDCGVAEPACRAALDAGLDAAGERGPIDLYATHGHVDHAGNAAYLKATRAARLHAAGAESAFIESFRRDAAPRNDAFARALAAHGCPPEVVTPIRRRGEGIDSYLDDTAIDVHLSDGERVLLGDIPATVHVAPGHTPGSILLEAHAESPTLVSGDTLLEHITSNAIELLDRDRGRYHTYVRTLASLARFAGCVVLPGHGPPFTLTQAILDGHLAKHDRRRNRILAALDGPRTAYALLPRVLPHLAHDQVFLGMCEVVGHLHALEIDGLVRARPGEVRVFERS